MLDVVPPRPPARKSRPRQKTAPSVLSLEWKLPSRLRRPIRDELARQRQQRRQREAVVQFKRRPLYTSTEKRGSAPLAPPRSNSGAEHHTGDVYRNAPPGVRLGLPPYAGRFMRGVGSTRAPRRVPAPRPKRAPLQPKPTEPVRSTIKPVRRTSSPQPIKSRSKLVQPPAVRNSIGVPLAAERDVPFVWQDYQPKKSEVEPKAVSQPVQGASAPVLAWDHEQGEMAEVQQPRRRFALPLHFSIWPTATTKKKVKNKIV